MAKRIVHQEPPDPVWVGMPLEMFQRVGSYIRDTANILGLYDWKLNLVQEPSSNEDCLAEVEVIPGRRIANVHLAKDFADNSRADMEHAVVHELLHVCLDPMRNILEDAVEPIIGKPAYLVLDVVLNEREEQVVDALAAALRPHLPRIPKAKNGKGK